MTKLVAMFMFPGYWSPNNETFSNVGGRLDCWLAGGNNVKLNKDNMNPNNNNPEFGFSLRLLKNWKIS